MEPNETAIGLTTPGSLGLEPYTSTATRHEACQLLQNIRPSRLPDRWYGLSVLQALVWTPQGDDPGSPAITPSTHRAIQHWVQRGGHLVVVLGIVGDGWFDGPLSHMLPPVKPTRITRTTPPQWLGQPRQGTTQPINMRALYPTGPQASQVSVLLKDDGGRPIVVEWRYGLGCVTVIGVDLTGPALSRMGLPNGPELWSAVFGWANPVFSKPYIEQEIKQQRMGRPEYRQPYTLDRFIPHQLAMRFTATAALLTAIVVSGLYWAIAGPISSMVLKQHKLTQHRWVVFVGVVAVFSACAWGGAWLMRPTRHQMVHFTVLDADARTGLVHARSWVSVFVPKHGRVAVKIHDNSNGKTNPADPPTTTVVNTLANPGFIQAPQGGGFLDPQPYNIAAAAPDQVTAPIRATTKQLELDYWGPLKPNTTQADSDTAQPQWDLPVSQLRLSDKGWPQGQLTHQMPAAWHNVLLVYCPGDGLSPRVWRRHEPWPAGQPMAITAPQQWDWLVQPFRYDDQGKRLWKQEGHLGRLIAFKSGQAWAANNPDNPASIADSQIVQAIEMLSFYSTLPPPDFRNINLMDRPANYNRDLTRAIDLTPLTRTRCMILIGHLEQSPLPVPFTVDNQTLPSQGWTVIRWIIPVQPPTTAPSP